MWKEGKQSVFILILLNEKAVKSSAIEEPRMKDIGMAFSCLSNILFDRFFFFFLVNCTAS